MQNKTFTVLLAVSRVLRGDQRGATAVEYALIVALVAGVLIGVVTLFGTTIQSMFNTVINALG